MFSKALTSFVVHWLVGFVMIVLVVVILALLDGRDSNFVLGGYAPLAGDVAVYNTTATGDDRMFSVTIAASQESTFELDVLFLLITINLLTGISQLHRSRNQAYRQKLVESRHLVKHVFGWRWAEYAVTATCVMVTVAVYAGQRSVTVLVVLSGLIASLMFHGYLLELIQCHDAPPVLKALLWPAWASALVLMAMYYFVVLAAWSLTTEAAGGDIPDFVTGIVVYEMVALGLFGVVALSMLWVSPVVYEAEKNVVDVVSKIPLSLILLFALIQ